MKEEIEQVRGELHELVSKYSMLDSLVLEKSIELDKLLNLYKN
ncbi:aspartyl-phosphate phosphatase Spo0E family protein [Paenibacillus sp. GCM10027626]